jgi:hypothetical protein
MLPMMEPMMAKKISVTLVLMLMSNGITSNWLLSVPLPETRTSVAMPKIKGRLPTPQVAQATAAVATATKTAITACAVIREERWQFPVAGTDFVAGASGSLLLRYFGSRPAHSVSEILGRRLWPAVLRGPTDRSRKGILVDAGCYQQRLDQIPTPPPNVGGAVVDSLHALRRTHLSQSYFQTRQQQQQQQQG